MPFVQPPSEVLDLFAVPEDVRPLPGGEGHSVLAGDLVLSPGRQAAWADDLYPVLARLAARLDGAFGEPRREVRIAMPIPARDGSWVVDGWAASRYEPGSRQCTDPDLVLAAGALLHAELAPLVPRRPTGLETPLTRWDHAERYAFGAGEPPQTVSPETTALLRRLRESLTDDPLGPDQLVHGDLANNVLLDAQGQPVVIDFSPYWRPALWAQAVAVLDLTMWFDADRTLLARWNSGARRQALLRAAIYRLLSDLRPDVARYRRTLAPLLTDVRFSGDDAPADGAPVPPVAPRR